MKRRNFLTKLATTTGAVALTTGCRQAVGPGQNEGVESMPETRAAEGSSLLEPAREIPVTDQADVLVVGGGPSGVAAAIAASRAGSKVILIERYNHLGGLWTGGLVLPLLSTHGRDLDKKHIQVMQGIGGEMVDRLRELDMIINEKNPIIDPEGTKYLLDVMTSESGVKVYYHCWAGNTIKKDDAIDAVVFETKSGRLAIRAKQVIDCTGDGDIFHLAGEDYEVMNFGIGLVHRLGNVDRIDKTKPGYKEMKIGGETPLKSVNWVNMTGGDYEDGLDFKRLSVLQQQHRKDIWEQVEEIKSVPGHEEVFLLDTAAQQGVRMSRILKGAHQLTLEESMSYAAFDDVVGVSGGWTSQLYEGQRVQWYDRPMWQIPYRALTPLKTRNLLVAGRCFSFEQKLFEDTRVIGTCIITGQAAGAASAVAVSTGTSVQDVDVSRIQSLLKEQKVYLA